jgi:hypothetical protein
MMRVRFPPPASYDCAMADHERELLQLIAGSPPEALGFAELGRQIGLSEAETAILVEQLVIAGRLRLVVVGEPAGDNPA